MSKRWSDPSDAQIVSWRDRPHVPPAGRDGSRAGVGGDPLLGRRGAGQGCRCRTGGVQLLTTVRRVPSVRRWALRHEIDRVTEARRMEQVPGGGTAPAARTHDDLPVGPRAALAATNRYAPGWTGQSPPRRIRSAMKSVSRWKLPPAATKVPSSQPTAAALVSLAQRIVEGRSDQQVGRKPHRVGEPVATDGRALGDAEHVDLVALDDLVDGFGPGRRAQGGAGRPPIMDATPLDPTPTSRRLLAEPPAHRHRTTDQHLGRTTFGESADGRIQVRWT